MRLLVNHQLIPVPIQSNSISLEQMLLKISIYCSNFTVLSSLFDVKKQRPTMNLDKYYQFSVNIEIFSGPESMFFFSNVSDHRNFYTMMITFLIKNKFKSWKGYFLCMCQ